MHFKKTQDQTEKKFLPFSQFDNQNPGVLPQQPPTAAAA